MKTKSEIEAKLIEMLQVDGHAVLGVTGIPIIYSKAAACKTLLWVLGLNDDDR